MSIPEEVPTAVPYEDAAVAPAFDTSVFVAPPAYEPDHCGTGLDRLLEQFKDKPRIAAFVCTFLDQIQDLEYSLWQLYTDRTIDSAVGAQLDGLGALVGEDRKSRVDDVYRRFIRVRILTNQSDGKIEQLYEIVDLALLGVTPTIKILEHPPASITITVDEDFSPYVAPEDLFQLLLAAKAAGVRLSFVYSYSSPATSLILGADADAPETDEPHGLGDSEDGSVGGFLASVLVG